MKKLLLLPVLFTASLLAAQAPTWAEDIAPIIIENCGACHHPGGIAPFSLLTYAEAATYAPILAEAVTTGHMPPWPPDPGYAHFVGERVLTPEEIAAIAAWAEGGAAMGDPGEAPPVPSYPAGGLLSGTPDLVLRIPTFTINSATDLYRCFALPTGLTEDRTVVKLEVVPGNHSAVHHVDTYYDPEGHCLETDSLDPAPGFSCFASGGCDYYETTFYNWSPGGDPAIYPAGMGKRLAAGSTLVFEIHYAPGSQGKTDSTEIRLWFAPETDTLREVVASAFAEPFTMLENPPYIIRADSIMTFHTRLDFNDGNDYTLLRVSPHMHLLGVSMEAFMVDPEGDTVPLISIPHWDFHWQGYYTYPRPIIIRDGSSVFSRFVYDNTSDNPYNPNFPPKNVGWGPTTADEMLILFVEYVEYRPGDEHIVQDSSLITPAGEPVLPGESPNLEVRVTPNPSRDVSPPRISFTLAESAEIRLSVLDARGREVAVVQERYSRPAGAHLVQLGSLLPPGIYFALLQTDRGSGVEKFVIIN
jgi:mono/diheme cytochrome c family protein